MGDLSTAQLRANGKPIAIALEEMAERAVVESWGPEGPAAWVQFKCRGADRFDVIKGLRGGVTRHGTTITYTPPFRYPPSPNMVCTAIGETRMIKPYTNPFGWVESEQVIIPTYFSVPSWSAIDAPAQTDASGIPMTTTRFKTSSSILAPPIGAYYYTSGTEAGKPIQDSSVGYIIGRCEISVTRHMVPFLYLEKPMFLSGAVNDNPITFGDYTFPKGCVLLAGGVDIDPNPDPATGTLAWDYTYTFIANYDLDWNEFLDPSGEFVLINTKADSSGEWPFPYDDFSPLFGTVF